MATGLKTGSLQTLVSSGGVSGNTTLSVVGTSNPGAAIIAPAGLVGTVLSAAAGTLTVADPLGLITVGGQSSFYLAVFWTTNAGATLNACFDFQYSTVSGSGTITITCTGGTASPTGAKYWASSGAFPTSLPANSYSIVVALATDVTDGISIPAGSGTFLIQQLLATSTQPGLVEYLVSAAGALERLSPLLTANAFDTWPTTAAQVGTLPSGGALAKLTAGTDQSNAGAWTTNITATVLRFYNLGCTPAVTFTASSTAAMQAGAIVI